MCEFDGELLAWMDEELAPAEAARVAAHVEGCAECRLRAEAYRLTSDAFAAYREAASAKMLEGLQIGYSHLFPQRRRKKVTVPVLLVASVAAAVCVAAGMALMHRGPEAQRRAPAAVAERPFVRIPYVPPLDGRERAEVVRMEIPVAALIAAGYEVGAVDPSAAVEADVLVGEDGRAHAVRLPGGPELRTKGD